MKLESSTMREKGFSETRDLEQWIVDHPDLLDDSLRIVTTQFNKWLSGTGSAAERLDILALATSGELVVIELKQASDRNIHLQAITYGALVSGFTTDTLSRAHAEWLTSRSDAPVTQERALELLQEHVDEWSEEVLQLPRLVLVAESFPAQVLTTVEWLRGVAEGLQIECHEYTVFHDDGAATIAFDRIYPVVDIADQILRPGQRAETKRIERRASSQRRAKSVSIIHEHRAIPNGAVLDLKLQGNVRPEVVDVVTGWLEADTTRRGVTWADDPTKPLRWAAAADPLERWTPSSLRNEIFRSAGAETPAFSAADAWQYQDKSLAAVAVEALARDAARS